MRPVSAAGPDHCRAAKSRPRLCRRRAVRAWPGLSRRPFRGSSSSPPPACASAIRALDGSGRHWSGEAPPADVFAVKADAIAALAASASTRANLTVTREAPSWFHPGRSGALKLGPKIVLGMFGEFHPDLLAKLGVDAPIAGFELYLDAIPAAKRKSRPSQRSTPQTCSRSSAISPSCSSATWRRATWCARRQAPTAC